METVRQAIQHTPWWVWVAFGFLVFRAVQAGRTNTVSLARLFTVPAIFLIAGIASLLRKFNLSGTNVLTWLVFASIGASAGYLIIRHAVIAADHDRGVIRRPADYSFRPLVLAVFAIDYLFNYFIAVQPSLLLKPAFQAFNIAILASITGIFVGKAATYVAKYHIAPHTSLPQGQGPSEGLLAAGE